MSNSIGTLLRVTSLGESHGRCIGVVLDGLPAGLKVNESLIKSEMSRRRPGQSRVSTARVEEDLVEILTGVYEGYTTGAPVLMLTWNQDQDSTSYDESKFKPRPGHADYAMLVRYGGFHDHRGGGRASGRVTAGFVMAGALTKQLLSETLGVEILAYTSKIGGLEAPQVSLTEIKNLTEESLVRCPHPETAKRMLSLIEEAKKEGDSLGGEVICLAINVPVGIGQPVFDTLEGDIAKALFAVPAVKAVEFGAGKEYASLRGSEANDQYIIRNERVETLTNFAGGILGGISNGMPIICRATIKPTPSISKSQHTVHIHEMRDTEITIRGRHDPCIVPRAVPVVESMMALVIADHALRRGLIPQVLGEKK